MTEIYTVPNDFSSSSFNIILDIQDKCVKQVNKLFAALDSNSFIYDDYSFRRDPKSNLTDKNGFYALVDRKTKKIYFGGTSNLSGRKASHNYDLFNELRFHKLSPQISKIMVENPTRASDFYFVPLVILNQNDLSVLADIKDVLDEIETKVLSNFLSSSKKVRFYNVKMTNQFQKNNAYGGSPQSGTPDRAVGFRNYAWESVSAAAKHLAWDRKTVRNYIQRGILKDLTIQAWDNFLYSNKNGIKFLNSDPLLEDSSMREQIKQDIKTDYSNQR